MGLDQLIAREWDWHWGSDLFHDIRQETLADERCGDHAEYAFLSLGELTAKCISNASWNPGLFDVHVPYRVDGHVRVYHGKLTQLPRRYVARERL